MPKLRDRASLRKTQTFEVVVSRNRFLTWSKVDKETMIKAIKQGATSTDELVNYFPHKTRDEVEIFFEDKMKKAKAKIACEKETKQPKNPWVKICDKLLEDLPDYTHSFDKIVGEFDSEVKREFRKNHPNWGLVHKYLTSLFGGGPEIKLDQREAGTVLMLLEDLLFSYQSHETSELMALCKIKYMFLSQLKDQDPETNEMLMEPALNLDIVKSSAPIPDNTFSSSTKISTSQANTSSSAATGRVYGHVVSIPSAKPKRLESLYSVNPLCIPIRLIAPNRKPDSNAKA